MMIDRPAESLAITLGIGSNGRALPL